MNFTPSFQKLLLEKPRYNLKHLMAENCDYSDTTVKSKNCYYSFCAFYCEDVYYARYSRNCSSSSGLTFCVGCQWCTECVDCLNCYSCDYCQNCQNCKSCQFCMDCFGCTDCFGCVGLYQKKFCLFNEQLSEEEYKKRLSQLNLNDPRQRELVKQRVEKLRASSPNLGLHQFQTEDCIGDHITESKNCFYCFDVFASEDCFYNVEANGNKDCCDITVCFESEKLYQSTQSPLCYNSNFLIHSDRVLDSEFCAYSKNLKNCFGCVYLQNKEYHILNQPYSPEEYEKEVLRIKKELQDKGLYNLNLYFASDYEKNRLQTEEDAVIAASFPEF